jgi:hypothetical protein
MTDTFGFAEAVASPSSSLRLRQGKVTAIAASFASVTVQIAGDTSVSVSGVKYLNSYSPAVGDAVWIVTDGSDLFVLGALNSVPSGGTNANTMPYAMAVGTVVVSLSGTANGNSAVTYPVNRFVPTGVAPYCFVTMISAAGGSQKFVPRALNQNTTGCSVYIYTGDSTTATANVTVTWLAVLINSTSASSGA